MTNHHATARWSGPVPTGEGAMTLGQYGPTVPFTLKARVEENAGASPEQMLAAALAGCFSMSLSNLVAKDGVEAADLTISTRADAHLVALESGFAITQIDLRTEGHVPGMSAERFSELAVLAKETCPVAKLYSSATITVHAEIV